MKCKDCIHFPVCCISDNADSDHADKCKHKLLSTPTGKWIIDSIGLYCSECKKHVDVTTDYCPFCGADMRGKEV